MATAGYIGTTFGHQERLRVWLLICERTKRGLRTSPREAATALDLNLARTAYHVRELKGAKVVKPVGTGAARGSVEHFYRAVKTPQEVFEQMVKVEMQAIGARIARTLAAA